MLALGSDDVAELATMGDVVGWVEEAYRQLGTGEAADVPRETVRAITVEGNLKSMPAVGPSGLGGYVYSGGFGNRPDDVFSKLGFVFDDGDGEMVGVVELDRLSWLRTGATSGVATRYAAREDARSLGVVGSGKQARSQLLAVAAVRDIETASVFSPTRSHRERFAEEVGAATGVDVTAVERAREAVSGHDVVCTATTSEEPVLDGDWLDPGTHVNAIGAHYPDQREVDTRTVTRSTVIVDSLARARKEEGELVIPAGNGDFEWEDAVEMGDVVTGAVPGRRRDDEVTYMTSGGLSIEVLVPARALLERAAEAGVGTEVDLPNERPLL